MPNTYGHTPSTCALPRLLLDEPQAHRRGREQEPVHGDDRAVVEQEPPRHDYLTFASMAASRSRTSCNICVTVFADLSPDATS